MGPKEPRVNERLDKLMAHATKDGNELCEFVKCPDCKGINYSIRFWLCNYQTREIEIVFICRDCKKEFGVIS